MSAIYWGIQKFGAERFDLTHLRPFMLEVTPALQPERLIKVVVSFGFHTFTRKRRQGDPPHRFMGPASDPRTFSPERLECSLHLPEIIRDAAKARVKISDNQNYMITTVIPIIGVEHTTIFKLEKSRSTEDCARMFVVSAHPRQPQQGKREVNFVKLVTRVVDQLPLHPK